METHKREIFLINKYARTTSSGRDDGKLADSDCILNVKQVYLISLNTCTYLRGEVRTMNNQ